MQMAPSFKICILSVPKRSLPLSIFRKEVFCTLQFDATHNWPGCPFEEVAYLRVPHRHMFHVKAYKVVSHDDRDTEFILLKHQILDFIKEELYDESSRTHVLGAMSCEMIAHMLIEAFDLSACEVSEDNENGCYIRKETA